MSKNKYCVWYRKFDGHFSMDCTNDNGKRANGNFKPCEKYKKAKWDFKYCPYCGKEIKIHIYKENEENA
jgi:hypothetical protein